MLEVVSFGLTVTGEIIIALVVLSVHMHIAKERKIDRYVLRYMKHERMFVYFGIFCLLAGFTLQVYINLFT
ncbi:MAG: hypothetical protein U5L75_01620 [Candidatus Campbellbacteria bacterium]|nr:hypothetical protein [Candidatus Campbellbacteria bacterium]